jgi:hypothetical protein
MITSISDKKMVTSYFRSCSGKSWGNECNKDWSHVTCKASCQGNYCNGQDRGKRYEPYLAEHKDDYLYDNGSSITSNIYLFVSMACVARYYQRKMMWVKHTNYEAVTNTILLTLKIGYQISIDCSCINTL